MNIRRYYVPNAIVFITQVVDRRLPIFTRSAYIDLLVANLRETEKHHPFDLVGHVFLPEHFHIMIHPTGDSNFSKIMQSVKLNFTKDYKELIGVSGKMKFWQKGFWDHVIRDEIDFERHLDYIHYNPVRHGLVRRSEYWAYSSFLSWKEKGVYPDRWGWTAPLSIDGDDWQRVEADYD